MKDRFNMNKQTNFKIQNDDLRNLMIIHASMNAVSRAGMICHIVQKRSNRNLIYLLEKEKRKRKDREER